MRPRVSIERRPAAATDEESAGLVARSLTLQWEAQLWTIWLDRPGGANNTAAISGRSPRTRANLER